MSLRSLYLPESFAQRSGRRHEHGRPHQLSQVERLSRQSSHVHVFSEQKTHYLIQTLTIDRKSGITGGEKFGPGVLERCRDWKCFDLHARNHCFTHLCIRKFEHLMNQLLFLWLKVTALSRDIYQMTEFFFRVNGGVVLCRVQSE